MNNNVYVQWEMDAFFVEEYHHSVQLEWLECVDIFLTFFVDYVLLTVGRPNDKQSSQQVAHELDHWNWIHRTVWP
jgi:hypothetical protein